MIVKMTMTLFIVYFKKINTMKETITQILNSIDKHIKKEIESGAVNRTIGRGRAVAGKNDMQVWITNRESKSNYKFYTDQYGRQNSYGDDSKVDTYTGDGPVTSKNSPWGRIILQNCYGMHTVPTPRGRLSFILENSANYIQHNGDAERLTVGVGEKGWVSLGKLQEALRKYAKGIDSLQTAKEEREAAKAEKARLETEAKQREEERKAELKRIEDEEEKKRVEEEHRREEEERQRKIREEEERIKKLKEEAKKLEDELTNQMAQYAKAASFIRKQATLRFNPVLDKVQDEIKFCNLFNGTTTIINGGPGTGKTTTLIQRLKLLICKLDLKDYVEIGECKLTDQQLDIVSDNGGNWMFFSPTELLKEYLKENMNYEGLQDTSNKVQVWNTYLAKILRDKYHLAGDNAPFSFKKKEHEGTILIKDGELDILDEYKEFFMNELKRELERVASLDISAFSWRILGGNIVNDCKAGMEMTNLKDLYLLLMKMERFMTVKVFDAQSKSISNLIEDFYNDIHRIGAEYMATWKRDKILYSKLLAIYKTDELDDETLEEDDDEDFYGATAENKLALDVRNLLRLLALQHLQSVEIEGRKANLLKLVESSLDRENIKRFSDIAYFNKNISPLIKGYVEFLMPMAVKSYKAFRKSKYEAEDRRWNLPLLKKIVGNDNRPLHPQEQALMLGFINNMLLDIKSISNQRFMDVTDEKKGHKYGKAFKELCRPVIGVDEATDYCMLDFYAINSLRNPEVSSITMTGDGMQCLKENGIFEWDMLADKRLFAKIEVKNLNVSYRQSKELLRLAHSLYRRALQKIAPYKCYFDEMDDVPKPLWYENDDPEKKAKWIVQRILEIKENYSFVPSIAIFVSNQEDASFLVECINDMGKLDEAGIDVKDCSGGDKLAANDTVRIFPIEKVKGMEFEVVFFYDIDKIKNLVERYLYVGLSRATFYLGVTSNPLESDILIQIQKQFNRRGNWKTLVGEDEYNQSKPGRIIEHKNLFGHNSYVVEQPDLFPDEPR